MGTFTLPPPTTSAEIASIETCYMISSTLSGLRESTSDSEISMLDEFLPPIPIEMAQKSIYLAWVENLKSTSLSVWVDHSLDFSTSSDLFSSMFLTDENILEAVMSKGEKWEYYHHHSHLLDYEENNLSELYHPSIKTLFSNSLPINAIDFERNYQILKKPFLSIF